MGWGEKICFPIPHPLHSWDKSSLNHLVFLAIVGRSRHPGEGQCSFPSVLGPHRQQGQGWVQLGLRTLLLQYRLISANNLILVLFDLTFSSDSREVAAFQNLRHEEVKEHEKQNSSPLLSFDKLSSLEWKDLGTLSVLGFSSNPALHGCEIPKLQCQSTWILLPALAGCVTLAVHSTPLSLSFLICKKQPGAPPPSWQWRSEMLMGALDSWDN